jgi:hypothetical protein
VAWLLIGLFLFVALFAAAGTFVTLYTVTKSPPFEIRR